MPSGDVVALQIAMIVASLVVFLACGINNVALEMIVRCAHRTYSMRACSP